MRFYLDEALSDRIANILRSQGIDALSSHECGRNGLPDQDQLRFAAAEHRCLVTRNHRDFIQLTNRFMEQQEPHFGVLIVPRSLNNDDFAGIARAIATFARDQQSDLPSYTVAYLAR